MEELKWRARNNGEIQENSDTRQENWLEALQAALAEYKTYLLKLA
jgi:hypothetical protein